MLGVVATGDASNEAAAKAQVSQKIHQVEYTAARYPWLIVATYGSCI
ncbi:MAG: hypothetical protein IPI10_19120 [Bacteroidetes bacterium]|nr:hypothetical protein [Bacteroidota bacterium]